MATAEVRVKKLNAASLNSVVGLSNENFENLAKGINSAFSDLKYDPTAKTFNLSGSVPGDFSLGAKDFIFSGMIKLVDGAGVKILSINDLADGGAGIINAPMVHAVRIGVKTFVLQDNTEVLQTSGEDGQIAWGVKDGKYDYWLWTGGSPGWVAIGQGGGGSGGGGTSSFGDTIKATLASGSSTDIVISKTGIVRGLNIIYVAERGSIRQMGRISITHDGFTPTMTHEYHQLSGSPGLTFESYLNEVTTEIILSCSVAAGINDVDFAYAIQKILS